MGGRLITRTAAVAGVSLGLLAAACFAPSTAIAGLLAEASAPGAVSTASWSAIPTGPGGTASTTSFGATYGTGSSRYTIVDVVNNGSTTITGFTLTANRAGSVQSCGQAWDAPAANNQPPRCNGATSGTAVGSLSGSGSTFTLAPSVSLAPGSRVRLRLGPYNSNANWTIAVSVTRAQTAASGAL